MPGVYLYTAGKNLINNNNSNMQNQNHHHHHQQQQQHHHHHHQQQQQQQQHHHQQHQHQQQQQQPQQQQHQHHHLHHQQAYHNELLDNKPTFIFEDAEVGLCDGILSDSNESTLSSETNGGLNLRHASLNMNDTTQAINGSTNVNSYHHQSNEANSLGKIVNGTSNTSTSIPTSTPSVNHHKRKLDDYLDVNENGIDSNGQPISKKIHTNGKKTKGRVKIKMEFIDNKLRRYTTFSKRKSGIMKKAYELSTLTGTQVMLLVASETGHVYTFATKKLKPMITSEAGKNLIRTCLFSPEPATNGFDPRMSATGYEETELSYSVNDDSSEKDEDSSSSTGILTPSGMSMIQATNGPNSSASTSLYSSSINANKSNNNNTSTVSQACSPLISTGSFITSATTRPSSSPSPNQFNSTTVHTALPISFLPLTSAGSTSSSSSSSSPANHHPIGSESSTVITMTTATTTASTPVSSATLTTDSSSTITSRSINSNRTTAKTFTAAILGGVLPSSTLLNGNPGAYQGANAGTISPSTLYKLPDFGATGLTTDSRLTPKVSSSTLFNTGSVVLCASTNHSNNSNTSNSGVTNGTTLMYHTPQGVVYATTGNTNGMFPENLILNFGQNLSHTGSNQAITTTTTTTTAASAAAAAAAATSLQTTRNHNQFQMISNEMSRSSHNQAKSYKSGGSSKKNRK